MTSVTQAGTSYAYTYAGTGQNEVLSQNTPNGTYTYTYGRTDQQGLPVIEHITAAGLTAYVEHDPVSGQPLLLRTSSGKQSLYVYDGTGNPVALLTDDSYQAFGYKYDPYGVPVLTQASGRLRSPPAPVPVQDWCAGPHHRVDPLRRPLVRPRYRPVHSATAILEI